MEDNNTRQMLRTLARQARHTPTPAEKELWERLRDHRCHGLHFRRQDTVGPFRLDFYCRSLKLAVEVDGSVHEVESVQRRDADRQQILEQEFGICFVRLTNNDVRDHLEQIVDKIGAFAAYLPDNQQRP